MDAQHQARHARIAPRIRAAVVLVAVWGVMPPPAAQQLSAASAGRPPCSLNVRDFGAKGDGISDDSDAIQRALLAAGGSDATRFMYWAWTAAPEVYFPEGTYLVSRTLLVPACGGAKAESNHINLRGEKATLKQIDPDRDILYFRLAHRNLVEGLTFEGGKRQLKIWSRNKDRARVTIRDCTFRNSSGYAIDDQLRIDPEAEPRNWYHNVLEPYAIEFRDDGLPMLTPVDESRYPMCLFVSTGMRISRCAFERCRQVLSVWADWALMDHCTIETHPDMDGPAIRCGAALMLEEVTGLARVTPGRHQWWITLDPRKQPSGRVSLDMQRVRLAADAEAGWCVVRNEAPFSGGCHVSIIADHCEFQSAGARENSLIYLVEPPNLISVSHCRETSGRKVNILGLANPLEEDALHRHSPEVFSFVLDDHNENLVANLPETMQPFADPSLPEAVAQRFDGQPPTVTLTGMREAIESQVSVVDYGAEGTGREDDSEAFQQALAVAGSQPGLVEVLIPAGEYYLARPVELPPRVVVRGVGQAALGVPSGRAGAIFTAPGAGHIAVQNLHFFDCEQALDIRTVPETRSDILVDNCRFHRTRRWAVTCLSGSGAAAETNKTTLRVSDCTFSLSPVLLQNVRYALVDNAWVTTDPSPPDSDSAVFANKGFLHLHTLLGVPRPTERDMRWVDNYGRVLLDRCRFGGEGGGLPMVVNFAARGEVLIQGSWLNIHRGNPKRLTVVDCEEIPALTALRGNVGWPLPQKMVTVRRAAQGALDGRFFESVNTVPRTVRDERGGGELRGQTQPVSPPGEAGDFSVSAKASAGETDGLPNEICVGLGGGVSMDMVLVQPGTFTMGSPAGEAGRRENENPFTVRITKPFYLGKHEVTQAVWERVMTATIPGATGRLWEPGKESVDITGNPEPSHFSHPERPVENIGWREAKELLARLNRLVTDGGFRLPTEAEWEYSARAGTATAYCFGDAPAGLDAYAWHKGNSRATSHKVGTKRPNPWGFHDMYGNVWEWCEDEFTGERYPFATTDAVHDPCAAGAEGGNSYQVVRGGSLAFSARLCRSATRSGFDPWQRYHDTGLRLARDAGKVAPASLPAASSRRTAGSLNVRDFGAKGDGISDDSDAIQRALLAAGGSDATRFMYWAWTAAPEVLFPEGTYLVSRTLLVPACGGAKGQSNHINLRGEKATIRQIDPEQDILYFRLAHRNLIEGLTFEGGKRQLKLWSRNLDQARVVIRNCVFRESSSYAIDDQLRLDPEVEPKDWYRNVLEPYRLELREDGLPMLTPVDESRYPICLFVSTGMRISHCAFERCMRALSVWADLALMDHCTIETHPQMEGPAILCGAALMMEDVTGLGRVTPGKHQWWITLDPGKHYSGVVSLHLKQVRLKTDSDAGLCIVRNEAKWCGGVQVSIIADGCGFQSAGSRENSVIYLVEVPNLINVRNSKEISDRKVNILGFDKPFDEEYFRPAKPWDHLTYIVNDHNDGLIGNLPASMQPSADQPLSRDVAQRFETHPKTVTLHSMREGIASQLNIRDFGAGSGNDAEAFRKAFDHVAGQPDLVEVLIPAGVYRFSRPVELPGQVVIRATGQAALTVTSGHSGSIFTATAPGSRHIVIQNLHFFDCNQALEINTEPDTRSDILLENCRFLRNSRWAVTCLSGDGAAGEANQTTLRLSNCTFSLSPVLLHNARYALVDNAWVTTDPSPPDTHSAVFVNRGFLHLHTLLGVPRPTERDMRWVDNHGRVLLDRCRFGGEGGGLPMVVNFAARGEVLIQGSWLFCRGNLERLTIVDCEEIPALIALRDNWGYPPPPGPQMMVTVREGAQGELNGRFFESCNTVWRLIRDERKTR